MQKIFEKIINKLKEQERLYEKDYNEYGKEEAFGNMNAFSHAIQIIDQTAENYKHVTTCYLQSICEYQNEDISINENDGWIPCSAKTPSGEFYHLVSTAKGGRTIARYKGLDIWWDLHNCEVEDEVIAWQELPTPYHLKEITKDCNTCANHTEPEGVDNGCYMCCKGLENNHEPKGEEDGIRMRKE